MVRAQEPSVYYDDEDEEYDLNGDYMYESDDEDDSFETENDEIDY